MDQAPLAPQANGSSSQRSPRQRGPRRGRGGASLGFRPASVAPGSQQPPLDLSSAENSGAEAKRGGGARRSRGGRPAQNRTVNGRQFGGRLTSDATNAPLQAPATQQSLQADAPAFVPGQTATMRSKQQPNKPRPQQKRLPKSQAPDIATRTHEDIDNGHYECPICTSDVNRKAKVWSCETCWTVFHLACVKKWSSNEGSAANQPRVEGEVPPPRQWRCPGCNLPKDDFPKDYTCWCDRQLVYRLTPAVRLVGENVQRSVRILVH
ncbi:FKBP12-associated protein [Elasticomyces elasticus]|nr:FKBP12-associated protein [Elasticomyces elasticus]